MAAATIRTTRAFRTAGQPAMPQRHWMQVSRKTLDSNSTRQALRARPARVVPLAAAGPEAQRANLSQASLSQASLSQAKRVPRRRRAARA
jgi:uncharacterized protein YjbI with pentapeptide repeats